MRAKGHRGGVQLLDVIVEQSLLNFATYLFSQLMEYTGAVYEREIGIEWPWDRKKLVKRGVCGVDTFCVLNAVMND